MAKTLLITCIVFTTFINLTLCDENNSNPSDPSPPMPEMSSYWKPAASVLQSRHSSVVNSDGSFEFVSEKNGSFIEIKGSIKEVNGTQMLVLQGTYLFGQLSLSFDADENGFNTQDSPALHPLGVPPRVIATIAG